MQRGVCIVTSDMGDAENPTPQGKPRHFDLSERTTRFSETVIGFCKRVPLNVITHPLIGQLVRASTSIGANYCEADDAFSRKEFRHRIGICRKEARETKYWLRLIVAAEESMKEEARPLWAEGNELHL